MLLQFPVEGTQNVGALSLQRGHKMSAQFPAERTQNAGSGSCRADAKCRRNFLQRGRKIWADFPVDKRQTVLMVSRCCF
jgi:hypothetical protein